MNISNARLWSIYPGNRTQQGWLSLTAPACGWFTASTAFLRIWILKVAPISVLCAMIVAAVLNRGKGRDFYDLMFLLQRTKPDYAFLEQKNGISNQAQLITELIKKVESTDLSHKRRDFEHLLIEKSDSDRIMWFGDFVRNL